MIYILVWMHDTWCLPFLCQHYNWPGILWNFNGTFYEWTPSKHHPGFECKSVLTLPVSFVVIWLHFFMLARTSLPKEQLSYLKCCHCKAVDLIFRWNFAKPENFGVFLKLTYICFLFAAELNGFNDTASHMSKPSMMIQPVLTVPPPDHSEYSTGRRSRKGEFAL